MLYVDNIQHFIEHSILTQRSAYLFKTKSLCMKHDMFQLCTSNYAKSFSYNSYF